MRTPWPTERGNGEGLKLRTLSIPASWGEQSRGQGVPPPPGWLCGILLNPAKPWAFPQAHLSQFLCLATRNPLPPALAILEPQVLVKDNSLEHQEEQDRGHLSCFSIKVDDPRELGNRTLAELEGLRKRFYSENALQWGKRDLSVGLGSISFTTRVSGTL